MPQTYDDPQHWYSTNLVGIPAWLIASTEFNEHPQPLRIAGAHETHRGLFHLLEEAASLADAQEKFQRYMDIVFQLKPSEYEIQRTRQRRYRPSYIKLIEGWGFDSNSPQGAVLKGWVESRFGLTPSFHKGVLQHYPSPAWVHYMEEKFSSRFHSNSIHMQLDLLFEFCQFVIRRFGIFTHHSTQYRKSTHVTLWRGINIYDEPAITKQQLKKGECIVRLNNLVSFSTSRERADEFGDWILETQVPLIKLIFFPGLLSRPLLSGEGEVLALGGSYRVKACYA